MNRNRDEAHSGSTAIGAGSRTWVGAHRRATAAGILALIGVASVIGALILNQTKTATTGPVWQAVALQGTLVHAIAIGANSTPAFAATHSGVFRRSSTGVWKRVLRSSEVWDLTLVPGNRNATLAGRTVLAAENSGTIAISHDGGTHWHRTLLASGGVFAVTVQPGHPQHLLAGADTGIFQSADGGQHWRNTLHLNHGAGDAFFWAPGSETVYAGTVSGGPIAGQQVYVSRDGGQSWHVFGRGLQSTGGVMSVVATSAGPVFAGTMGNATWSAASAGSTWHKTATGMPPTEQHIAGMAVVPGSVTHVIAGTLGSGVFVTVPGSGHWTDVSGSLHNAIVLSVVYSPLRQMIYACTDHGLYAIQAKQLFGTST